jgi:hypothetical protein
LSVPSTPTAMVSHRIEPSAGSGSATFFSAAEFGVGGATVTANIVISSGPCLVALQDATRL